MKIEELGVMDLASEPRHSLGDHVPFFFYRYLSLFAVAESKGRQAEEALRSGGRKVGVQLVKGMMYRDIDALSQHFAENGQGIVSLEKREGAFTWLRLEECATCSGLPPMQKALCYFDGGILAGALEALSRSTEPYAAYESECAGLGNSSCLFKIGPRSQMPECEEGE